jgi:hypothetical protein
VVKAAKTFTSNLLMMGTSTQLAVQIEFGLISYLDPIQMHFSFYDQLVI